MFKNLTIDVNMQKQGLTRLASGIPLWALTELGKEVKLYRPFDEYGDGRVIHKVFTKGTLDAIQAESGDGLGVCAVVEFETGNLVRVPWEYLEK
jgi:hypothetical protein